MEKKPYSLRYAQRDYYCNARVGIFVVNFIKAFLNFYFFIASKLNFLKKKV